MCSHFNDKCFIANMMINYLSLFFQKDPAKGREKEHINFSLLFLLQWTDQTGPLPLISSIYIPPRPREREIERLGVFNQKRRYKNKEIPREWLCRIASQLGLFSSVFLYNYVVNFFPLLLSDSPCCFSNPFFACAQWTWLGIFHFFFQNLLSSSSSSFLYCRTRSRRKRRRK